MRKVLTVDEYIEQNHWSESLSELRKIVLSTGLEETVKWGAPVYVHKKKNIVGIGGFKEFVSIWFFNGVFLKDSKKKLINAQEGTTKALRQWRFTNLKDIQKDSKLIKEYIFEAIEVENKGLGITPEKNKSFSLPKELSDAIKKDKNLKKAFESLSKAKQREYAEHIGSAKKEETRIKRLEKALPLILSGVGLNDKYKK